MVGNIFENVNIPEKGELFEEILKTKNILIERIISSDNIKEKEYLQEQDEWVILLRGEAKLEIKGETMLLKEGDYIFIPSNTPHKVLETSKGAIWLAVHIF